jgi:hypothetical protein
MNNSIGPFWCLSIAAIMVSTLVKREENGTKHFEGKAMLVTGGGRHPHRLADPRLLQPAAGIREPGRRFHEQARIAVTALVSSNPAEQAQAAAGTPSVSTRRSGRSAARTSRDEDRRLPWY